MRSIKDIAQPWQASVRWKGGGGGGSSTTTSGIDPEFKPYLVEGLKDANTMRKAEAAYGGRNIQDAALTQRGVAEDILNRASIRDQAANAAYKQAQGTMPGQLGSARAQAMAQQASFNAGLQQQAQEDATRAAAAQQLMGAAHSYDDAPHRSLQRYFGYLQNAPKQNTTTQSGGGK